MIYIDKIYKIGGKEKKYLLRYGIVNNLQNLIVLG